MQPSSWKYLRILVFHILCDINMFYHIVSTFPEYYDMSIFLGPFAVESLRYHHRYANHVCLISTGDIGRGSHHACLQPYLQLLRPERRSHVLYFEYDLHHALVITKCGRPSPGHDFLLNSVVDVYGSLVPTRHRSPRHQHALF